MKCDVIKDLIPSYIDELTSEESNKLILEHINTCDECFQYLNEMKKEIESEKNSDKVNENPFVKIKRDVLRKIILAIFVTAAICGVLVESYQLYYFGGESVKSDEVEMKIVEMYGIGTLCFEPVDKDMVMNVGYTENKPVNGEMPIITLSLFKQHKHPKNDSFEANKYQFYFVDDDTMLDLFSGVGEFEYGKDDFLAIEYDDKVEIIYLSELRNL